MTLESSLSFVDLIDDAVISVVVYLFLWVPIIRHGICLVCGIVFIILAPTLAVSPELFWFSCGLYF